MRKWARVGDDGLVLETTDIDPKGRFVTSLQWISCPEEVSPGWSRSGKIFQPPAEPDLDHARESARAEGLSIIAGVSAPILAAYTPAERDSWPTQAAEARAVQAGGTSEDAPMLTILAEGRGVSLIEMAILVLQQSGQFMAIAAAEQRLRRALEADLSRAASSEAIQNVLSTLRTSADALSSAIQRGDEEVIRRTGA